MAVKLLEKSTWLKGAFKGSSFVVHRSRNYHQLTKTMGDYSTGHSKSSGDDPHRTIWCYNFPSYDDSDTISKNWAPIVESVTKIETPKGPVVKLICKTKEKAVELTTKGIPYERRLIRGFYGHPKISIPCCNFCLSLDHLTKECKSKKPKCSFCGNDHLRKDCDNDKDKSKLYCANCNESGHSAFYAKCPKRCEIKDHAIAEKKEVRNDTLTHVPRTSGVTYAKVAAQPVTSNLSTEDKQEIADMVFAQLKDYLNLNGLVLPNAHMLNRKSSSSSNEHVNRFDQFKPMSRSRSNSNSLTQMSKRIDHQHGKKNHRSCSSRCLRNGP